MIFRQINPHLRRFFSKVGRLFLSVLGIALILSGCRLSTAPASGSAIIELLGPQVDPAVGQGLVLLRVTDQAGRPLDDAIVHLKGDMTHAGMVPVLAESSLGEAGLYRVPFEWTMAGDWILTVVADLPAGERLQARFPIRVSGEDPGCETDEKPADGSERNSSG